jgi:hypothetical protein
MVNTSIRVAIVRGKLYHEFFGWEVVSQDVRAKLTIGKQMNHWVFRLFTI